MSAKASERCEGKRRMWRGRAWGTFKCGRKATTIVETRVGLTRTHRCCDDAECFDSIRGGYAASSRPIR